MRDANLLGRWSSLFSEALIFDDEILHAMEVTAQWRRSESGRQIDVVLENLKGYVRPAWGSDTDFLYVRNPEGVWKSKLDRDIGTRQVIIHQYLPDGAVSGGVLLGRGIENKGGWFYGSQSVTSASVIDESHRFGVDGIDADELGSPLFEFAELRGSRDVVLAGDSVGHSDIRFERNGDWLIVVDLKTNRKIAYDIAANRAVLESAMNDRLWLRFNGPWMTTVDKKVKLVS